MVVKVKEKFEKTGVFKKMINLKNIISEEKERKYITIEIYLNQGKETRSNIRSFTETPPANFLIYFF